MRREMWNIKWIYRYVGKLSTSKYFILYKIFVELVQMMAVVSQK
jgi:hypothetical protein